MQTEGVGGVGGAGGCGGVGALNTPITNSTTMIIALTSQKITQPIAQQLRRVSRAPRWMGCSLIAKQRSLHHRRPRRSWRALCCVKWIAAAPFATAYTDCMGPWTFVQQQRLVVWSSPRGGNGEQDEVPQFPTVCSANWSTGQTPRGHPASAKCGRDFC